MNMNFEFLTNLSAIEIVKEVKQKGIKATPKNPTGMKLRIFKDGAIYPSQELVDKFGLEYANKNEHAGFELIAPINGFDIWSSKDWGQYPKDAQQVVFIAAVAKSEPKVSVFGSVDYNTDGTPKKSVMNQGSKRPEIVEMLREVYDKTVYEGISENTEIPYTVDLLFGSKNYVDLDVNTEVVVFEGLPAYYIPKSVSRGPKVGQMTYDTRTGLTVMPLTIHVYPEATFGELTDSVEEVENKELEETV